MVDYSRESSLAINLVEIAAKITEWFKIKHSSSYIKKDDSPVTLADFASQILIISEIRKNFPNDQIIAEEESGDFFNPKIEELIKRCYKSNQVQFEGDLEEMLNYRGPSSNRQWTVDPIDGTKGFQEDLAYAIGIGFMIGFEPKICAIGVPNYKDMKLAIFAAEKNQGARVSFGDLAFTKLKVSSNEDIKKFRMCYSLHYNKPWVLEFANSIGISSYIRMDSMAKLCMIADGSAEIYVKPLNIQHSYTWDFLPGDLLVREAGGMITDLKGESIKYIDEKCIVSAPGLIASNGLMHNDLIQALQSSNVLENS
ncbi:MAG: hypothetical protein EAX91_06275 [Candidatus Lokiarchaeota archaeon]|nr:hypothetical protein [Candidatus Lokiarchaeota archaeon]